MSKIIAANLASALVLIAAGSAFAAPDSTPSPAPTAQDPSSAAQSPSASQPAQTPAAQQAAAAGAKKKPSPDDVICKPDVGTGSRVGGAKICLTRAQWRQRQMD